MSNERPQFRTPKGRLSFPSVFHKAPALEEGQKDMYQTTIILPKGADLSELKAMIEDTIKATWPKRPASLKLPIRDGAEKAHVAGFGPDTVFFTARTQNKPPVVNAGKVSITNEDEIYGGCYAKISVTPFAYDKGVSKGVGLALNAVQKVADGEPFASTVDPDVVFDDESDEAEGGGW